MHCSHYTNYYPVTPYVYATVEYISFTFSKVFVWETKQKNYKNIDCLLSEANAFRQSSSEEGRVNDSDEKVSMGRFGTINFIVYEFSTGLKIVGTHRPVFIRAPLFQKPADEQDV